MMTTKELETIRSAGFLILVIHGRLVSLTADIIYSENGTISLRLT